MAKNTLKKNPVKGMNDILPREKAIRDYVTSVITQTYRSYGFTPIETPAMEDIGNLSSKQGGENEKLIFKVLKRGRKLDVSNARSEAEIVDFGMRYDLTLPLSRFYAANANNLPKPFKALQIGSVWRADRPQRGRLRQFTQCDIDILGDSSNLCEIELILATSDTLGRLGFKGFEIRINDRRLLKLMAQTAGFPAESFEDVFICLDKLDKIGTDGVRQELLSMELDADSVDRYLGYFDSGADGSDFITSLGSLESSLGDACDSAVTGNLREIADAVNAAKTADFELVFDPTLVRGMGYYTGPIFEIAIPEFGGSCGGGGRYDEMIGRFAGTPTPACGFSIGFERIIILLLESGFEIPEEKQKVAFLIEKKVPPKQISAIMKEAADLRSRGSRVLVCRMNKNKKFQKNTLMEEGYTEFKEFYRD